MTAPVPQTIAQDLNEDIIALGCVPVRERNGLGFMRQTREIERKIEQLKSVDAADAYALEMHLAGVLRDEARTHASYKKARHLVGVDALFEENYGIALGYLGEREKAVERFMKHCPPSKSIIESAANYYVMHGFLNNAKAIIDDAVKKGIITSDDLSGLYANIKAMIECREAEGIADADVFEYCKLFDDFVTAEGLFGENKIIETLSDEYSTWISYHILIKDADIDQLMDLNERWIDTALEANIPPKIHQHICTMFVGEE